MMRKLSLLAAGMMLITGCSQTLPVSEQAVQYEPSAAKEKLNADLARYRAALDGEVILVGFCLSEGVGQWQCGEQRVTLDSFSPSGEGDGSLSTPLIWGALQTAQETGATTFNESDVPPDMLPLEERYSLRANIVPQNDGNFSVRVQLSQRLHLAEFSAGAKTVRSVNGTYHDFSAPFVDTGAPWNEAWTADDGPGDGAYIFVGMSDAAMRGAQYYF